MYDIQAGLKKLEVACLDKVWKVDTIILKKTVRAMSKDSHKTWIEFLSVTYG